MKKYILKWILLTFILFSIFQSTSIVNADDKYEKQSMRYEEHDDDYRGYDDDDEDNNGYRKHDDDDDEYHRNEDDDEYEKYNRETEVQSQTNNNSIQHSLWNIWTRDTNIGSTETLPFQVAKEVNIELNGKIEQFFIVPQNGQLLVSGAKIAQLMKAKFKFYDQSRILEVTKGDEELIVRVNSNAAYENLVKTQMPAKALYYEKTVYLPVSVIANSMGYRVSWDAEKETIILQEIL